MISDLSVAYDHSTVLFNINLEVQGSVTGIVGRNGAGKTTLLKTIMGLIRPKSGKIFFKKNEINNLPPYKIARLGIKYVPQDKMVFTRLTTYENLQVALAGLPNVRNKKEEIDKVLDLFPRLRVVSSNKAGTLSGGERQMLNIAMALLGSSEILLLDEPTEGLAPAVRSELGTVLNEISKNVTIVLVEQNVPLIKMLCEKLYVLKEGRIVREEHSKDDIRKGNFEAFL